MNYKKDQNQYFIQFDRGEEVLSSLLDFFKAKELSSAEFRGIGAVRDAEVGYYDLEKKEYVTHNEPEICELASFTGNISFFEDSPKIHAHGVLQKEFEAPFAGHLLQMTSAITVEITLQAYAVRAERILDDYSGLPLLSF